MRRRELIAGIGGGAVLAAGGAVAVRGPPALDRSEESTTACVDDPDEPVELAYVDAWNGGTGTVAVPDGEAYTFVEFFATWCSICRRMLPAVTEAHERVGDEVRFLSVTPERVGPDGQVTEDELAAWWAEHGGGDWPIAIDETATLQAGCESWAIPSAVVVDAEGVVRWSHAGEATADELVEGVETALGR